MADDEFWGSDGVATAALNRGQWYSSTVPGAGVDERILQDSGALGQIATRGLVSSSERVTTVHLAKPLLAHPPLRYAAHPGGVKPRKLGTPYREQGLMRRPLKARFAGISALPKRVVTMAASLPTNFCYNPSDLTEEQDQGACGSCWAFSLAHMLADRVSAQSGGKTRCALSPVQIMECADYMSGVSTSGCDGNDIYVALKSIMDKPTYLLAKADYPRDYATILGSNGVQANSCTQSDASAYGVSCKEVFRLCDEVPADDTAKTVTAANEQNIMQSIYNEGPVMAAMICLEEFSNYDGKTIYEPSRAPTADDGGHAIEIVGWGVDPGSSMKYWVCRNSWGDNWPAQHRTCAGKGFFYMRKGNNTCNIESYALAALPLVRNPAKAPAGPSDARSLNPACMYGKAYGGMSGAVQQHPFALLGVVLVVAAVAMWGTRYMRRRV
jgi:hypothetical protein